jgi:hypothetical protein
VYQFSDADKLQELCCRFSAISVSILGFGFGPTASYFFGTAADGRQIHGIDIGPSFGIAAGSLAKYSTWTDVQQQNNPLIANSLRGLWDALVPPGAAEANVINEIIKKAKTDIDPSASAGTSAGPCA